MLSQICKQIVLFFHLAGVLTVAGHFDHEKDPLLEVWIRAEDLGEPQNSDIAQVLLNVVDINDNPPVFNSSIPTEIAIAEDAEIGTKVVKVKAIDLDTDHAEITYAITAGNTAGKFDIDAITVSVVNLRGNNILIKLINYYFYS